MPPSLPYVLIDYRPIARSNFLPCTRVVPPHSIHNPSLPYMHNMAASNSSANGPNPLCRCRVLYIGSAVPTVTKDGLQGIQQPLRERYPAGDCPDAKGIDSWLSVWYNGLLLEYVDGDKRTENAFFPINSLHYCAGVRYVNMGGFAVEGGGERFIPLDSPFALSDSQHPPIFAAIFRRTTGVKVLECHGFVCTNEKAANALVRCCFHAYADTMYLKLDEKLPAGALTGGASPLKAIKEPASSRSGTPSSELNLSEQEGGGGNGGGGGPPPPLAEGTADWNERAIGQKTWQRRQQSGEYDANSLASSLAKRGGGPAGRQQQEGTMVPYDGGPENGFSRRAASHTELRSPAHDFFDSTRRLPPPFFYGPPMPPPPLGMHPFFNGQPPPGHHPFLRPPTHHLPPFPPSPHFFPPRPAHFPPHFGRIAPQFPPPPPPHPFILRPFFMIPPPFIGGPHLPPGVRPKSPDRSAGSGPIITETVYDTFPRHNRATYEEPIYMPSSNNPMPPHASYKPGSFSPELYEHYYETYKQHRKPQQQNVSRSNSDASGDYWERGFDTNAFRKAPRANERAFASTLMGGEGGKQQKTMGPKVNGTGEMSGSGGGEDGGGGTLTTRGRGEQGEGMMPGTSNGGRRMTEEPRPETPPADYELGGGGAEMRSAGRGGGGGHRTTAY